MCPEENKDGLTEEFVKMADMGLEGLDAGLTPENSHGPAVELLSHTRQAMRRFMSSPAFSDLVAQRLADAAEPVIVEVLAEWLPKIEQRVRDQAKVEFERRIEFEVRTHVETAIQEVRDRLARG